MTRQVTDLLLLYQPINFPTPPLLATRLLFPLSFFFSFPLIHGIHTINLALHCVHSPLYLPSTDYFSTLFVLHKIHISLSFSPSLRKLDLLLISTIPSSVPLFLIEDLQIPLQDANFNAKHKHLVIFSLSSIVNLKKKDFITKIYPHHQQD